MSFNIRSIICLFMMAGMDLAAAPYDADEDGLRDVVESGTGIFVSQDDTGTKPNVLDSDGDSMPDGMEVRLGTNPNDAASKISRPNIILINCDDLGYGDMGCFWQNNRTGTQKFATPELDKMAAEGAMMTHHYAGAPMCAPSRACLLQGRHQGHSEIRDRMFDVALPDNHSIAAVLKASGYYTVHVGKAGLAGNSTTGNPPAHPLMRGFNRFFGYLSHFPGAEHYPRNGTTSYNANIYDNTQKITNAYSDLFTSDAWTGFAKQTIIEQATSRPERPFFIYLAYDTPHWVSQVPPTREYPSGRGLNGGIQWTGAPSYVNTAINDPARIDNAANIHAGADPSWPLVYRKFVSMIRRIDDSMADILQTLKDLSIAENTLVVFTSDNGPGATEVDPRFFQSYAGFEGMKETMHEGGIRVPTLVWWPGKIPGTGNVLNIRRISSPSANYDWLATFADLACAPVPAYTDGSSLWPDLVGAGSRNAKDYLYFEFWTGGNLSGYADWPNHGGSVMEQMQAIRIGDYMGLRTNVTNGLNSFRIYDVTRDPKQSSDLAGGLPELQERMKYLSLAARRPILAATVPSANRPYDGTPVPALSPRPVRNGVYWKGYEGNWPWLPEFRHLTQVVHGMATTPDLSVRSRNSDFGVVFEGYLKIATTGSHIFQLSADSECGLWINEAHVIDNDYNFLATRTSAPIVLSAGFHAFRMAYRHQAGSPSLQLRWSGPGFVMQAVPDNAFWVDGAPTVVGPDAFITNRNVTVGIEPLANDSGEIPLVLDSASTPMFGSVGFMGKENLYYHPGDNFIGVDRFGYRVNDGVSLKPGAVEGVILFDSEIWFPLDEGQGTLVRQKGGGGTGAMESAEDGGLKWVSGKAGRALRFSKPGDRVRFPGVGWPSGATERTISVWLRTTENGSALSQTIFNCAGDAPGAQFTIRLVPLDGDPGRSVVSLDVDAAVCRGTQKVNDGLWHHVAIVLADHNTNGLLDIGDTRIFIDGLEDSRGFAGEVNQRIQTADGTAVLGGAENDNIQRFVGDLDEVRVFGRALSQEEVALLHGLLPRTPDFPGSTFSRVRDLDSDGVSDDSEYIAGTDPEDPKSRPSLRVTSDPGAGRALSWRAIAGRTYVIEESDDLIFWGPANFSPPLEAGGQDRDISRSLPVGGGNFRFYRLRIQLTQP